MGISGALYGSALVNNGTTVPTGYIAGSNLNFNNNTLNLSNTWSVPVTVTGDVSSGTIRSGYILVNGNSYIGSLSNNFSTGFNGLNVTGTSQFGSMAVTNPTSTTVPLTVSAFLTSTGVSTSSYSATNGYLGLSGLSTNTTATLTASFASGIALSGEIDVTSDKRNKKDIQPINQDLALDSLIRLEPVKFTWIDNVLHSQEPVNGFIAQDVKSTFPEAVTSDKSTFVADIYKLVPFEIKDNLVSVNENLHMGDTVRCYVGDTFEDVKVLNNGILQVTKPEWQHESQVFLYGKQVNDFHTLEPEQLIALNAAAIQKLNLLFDNLHERVKKSVS